MGNILDNIANFEGLLDPSNIDKFQKAFAVIQKAQNNVASLNRKDDPAITKAFKVGTTLTTAMLLKIQEGKLPTDYTAEDWEDIVDHISEYAVEAEDRKYSAYVFMFYSWYIEVSVAQIAMKLSEEKRQAILLLSEELKTKTKQFEQEEIEEVKYIEDCLWICLEAMIKLISGTIDSCLGFDKNQVVEAAMIFGLEYGRLILYKREHALVTGYLENQKILDAELAMRYEEYVEALEKEMVQFNAYIDSAFEAGFGQRLRSSAELAMAAGVSEDEVLVSVQDVDDFFL